jgi:hypothetical protein
MAMRAAARGAGFLLPVLTVLAATAVGCGQQRAASDSRTAGPDAPSPSQSSSTLIGAPLRNPDVYSSPFQGIEILGDFELETGGRVVDVTMMAAGGSDSRVLLYPSDWDYSYDGPPPKHPLIRAGEQYRAQGSVIPACSGAPHPTPEFVLTSRTEAGQLVESRFPVIAPNMTLEETHEAFEQVAHRFCESGVQATRCYGSISADRQDVTIKYCIRNPGPHTVLVSSEGWSDGSARWLPASIEVPANGELTQLAVTGEGGVCDSSGREGPLLLGLITATTGDGTAEVQVQTPEESDMPACDI